MSLTKHVTYSGTPRTPGERARILRSAKGLTLRQLAKLIDVSNPFISQFETGKTDIGLSRATKLARALGCSLDYLATGRRAKLS